MCRPLLLRQMYPGPYNAGGTALSRVPTLQKLLLLQGFLAPPQVIDLEVTSGQLVMAP